MPATAEQQQLSPEALAERLKEILFADSDLNVFAILDGASIPDLLDRLAGDKPEYICLYRGELDEDLSAAAPYLVLLLRDSAFTDWLLREGWGNHWGIFATANADMKTVRKHCRRLLIVRSPDGDTLYFRYYDPRVWISFLPIMSKEHCEVVYGNIVDYIVEGPRAECCKFNCSAPTKMHLVLSS